MGHMWVISEHRGRKTGILDGKEAEQGKPRKEDRSPGLEMGQRQVCPHPVPPLTTPWEAGSTSEGNDLVRPFGLGPPG